MATVARCNCGQDMQILDEDLGVPVQCPGCAQSVIVRPGSTVAIPVPPPHRPAGPPPISQPTQLDYGQAVRPHRGVLILVLGILAFVGPCPGIFFAIAAWIMANRDLERMAAGAMDPGGEGLTRAGRILGIIFVVLHLLILALFCLSLPFQMVGLSIG